MNLCVIPARGGSKRIPKKNIKKGEKFSKNNIRVIRPGYGLAPKYFNKILNKKSPVNILKHEPLKSLILKIIK